MGVSVHKLNDYHLRHGGFWEITLKEATKGTAKILRSVAGTAKIFANQGRLIRVAAKAAEQLGKPVFRTPKNKLTLTDFLEKVYLPSRISVLHNYEYALRGAVTMLSAFLGRDIALHDLKEYDVAAFLGAAKQSRSATTVNDYRSSLLTLWRAAYDNDMTKRPPRVGLVRKLRAEVDPPVAWTVEDCNRLFSTAANWPGMVGDIPAGQWWLSLLLTVYYTSARIGALRGTTTDCYTSGAGLLVRKQKNHQPQWYALPPTCCEAIDITLSVERKLLWPWPHCPRYLWTCFRRIVEAAGLPSPKTGRHLFHRLRRTSLSLCAAVDPAIAQRQAGHSSYATTLKHYVDPRIARGRSAADVLPEPVITKPGAA